MSPREKARLTFAWALALLLVSGLLAGFTISRLIRSAEWVAHTYDVRLALGDFAEDMAAVARARTGYILSGKSVYVSDFDAAKNDVPAQLQRMRNLVQDNPEQQRDCEELEILTDRRLEILTASMDLQEHGPPNDAAQTQYSMQLSRVAPEYNGVIQRMQQSEQGLLNQRIRASDKLFKVVVGLLCATFALAIALLWMHYRFLTAEAGERERAEHQAHQSEDASRRLSARVLQLQDEERRRFSRELHDGLGQSLTVAKMMAESLTHENHDETTLTHLVSALDEALAETRTISYLLHPPLLDELGLASATKWYMDGFAKRTGIEVRVDVANDVPRLPAATELALFRVLQESLTNIHRHSKCSQVRVSLVPEDGNISLVVGDNGRGIPAEIVQRFESSGTHVGVGLAGMRERIREQGGEFRIKSDAQGTAVSVVIPVSPVASGTGELEAAT